MDPITEFKNQREHRIDQQGKSENLKKATEQFLIESIKSKYSYNFSWMGRPIIQYPQDIVAMQEIIWDIKPDLIIETGVAHGGSLILYASLLELIGKGEVLGIDIDIRAHNREAIESHKMSNRIKLIQGSSIAKEVVDKVRKEASGKKTVIVLLDSNHTHDHVLEEMNLYSSFVTPSSYLVVFDTVVEDLPGEHELDRPWGKGNNPKTAVWEFLKSNDSFQIDESIQNKLLITVAPDGYLKRIK
jgi:cephalosporin hydroxylase